MNNDSNNSEKLPSDKEIKKFMKDFIREFKPYAAKLTGENIPMAYNRNDLQNVKNFIELANDYNKKESSISSENIPEQEKLKKRMDLTDEILRSILGLKSGNPAYELARMCNPKNSYEKIIPDVNYRISMRGTMHKILYTIDQMGKLDQVTGFINSMRPEDVFAMSQSSIRINEIVPFVLKTRKIITKELVEQYVEDYKEISGFLEPLIVVIFGMHQIIQNKYKSFTEIKEKIPIGNLVNQLKSDQMFQPLMEKYEPHTRNSIIHVSYHIDPMNKKIEFNDKGKIFSLTYLAFIEYVKEIMRLAIIISHFEEEVRFLTLLGYSQKRDNTLNFNIEY